MLLFTFILLNNAGAGMPAYQHPVDNNNAEHNSNIIAYEIFMRYHELALRYAGSPYAYPALGSIMSSTVRAYAAAGGMNRRLAGEDFYFMQQLRKTGTLDYIPNAMVYPACRSSDRTPFGTGRSISTISADGVPYAFLFHPECYAILRLLINSLSTLLLLEGKDILDAVNAIHPELKHFMKQKRFATHWDKIAANHHTIEARILQFHIWFDGLRTVQLIHHLRDTAFPNVLAEDALRCLFSWYATPLPTNKPMIYLRELRRLCTSTCAGSPNFIE